MKLSWFRSLMIAASVAVAPAVADAQQANFDTVGRQMAIMLQNSHFARLPYNTDLSQRFLDEYLRSLDSQRLYFTQQDIDLFKQKYGDRIHTLLLQGDSMGPATEIFNVFAQRVSQRVATAESVLAENHFDFSKDESVMLSRKDTAWPVDEAEATDLWRKQIKEAVLGETLRRETLTRLANEQGKADPSIDDRNPTEKVGLRYKRFLTAVKDTDEEEVASYFLSAVAMSYDPHTDYMSFREMNRFRGDMKNELVGIGALLAAEEDGATKIIGIVVGGPADREGTLKLNDRIVAVDPLNSGKPEDMLDIMFMKIDKVVDYIRGKESTSVRMKVEPAGGAPGETKFVTIHRGKVEMKDEQASGELIEMTTSDGPNRRLGIITLPSFYADFEEGKVRCSIDVERILKQLMDENIDGLVLDLRNNGGGSLEEVRRMTGFFIPRGPVVQVKNALGQAQVKDSEHSKPIYEGPMVVVVDKSSASASEILAGALQDYNRAVIVGESSTFGKGTVQQPMDIGRMLPLFSARERAGFLKVTIQKFYRPSGSSTQLEGVVPQIILPSLMDAMEVGEAYLRNPLPHDRIHPAADFRPSDEQNLFLPRLKELSQERVKQSKDFGYVIDDVLRARERIALNELSLNKEVRLKDIVEADVRQKARNAERRERFTKVAEQDRNRYQFYKVTLDNLDAGRGLVAHDPTSHESEFMRRAKDETEELDDTPEWPSGMDPMKRESMAVLRDLVDLTENAEVAGLLKRGS